MAILGGSGGWLWYQSKLAGPTCCAAKPVCWHQVAVKEKAAFAERCCTSRLGPLVLKDPNRESLVKGRGRGLGGTGCVISSAQLSDWLLVRSWHCHRGWQYSSSGSRRPGGCVLLLISSYCSPFGGVFSISHPTQEMCIRYYLGPSERSFGRGCGGGGCPGKAPSGPAQL